MKNIQGQFKTRLPALVSVLLHQIESMTLTDIEIDGRSTNYTLQYDPKIRKEVYRTLDNFYQNQLLLDKRFFLILDDITFLNTLMHQKENPLTDWRKYRFKSNIKIAANQRKTI